MSKKRRVIPSAALALAGWSKISAEHLPRDFEDVLILDSEFGRCIGFFSSKDHGWYANYCIDTDTAFHQEVSELRRVIGWAILPKRLIPPEAL